MNNLENSTHPSKNQPLQCLDIAKAGGLVPGKQQGDEVAFHCPNPDHEDRHPSCLINPKKNLFFCGPCGVGGNAWQFAAFLAGCKPEEKRKVANWLREHGLLNGHQPQSGKLPETWKGKQIKKWYEYQNLDGSTAFHVARVVVQDS